MWNLFDGPSAQAWQALLGLVPTKSRDLSAEEIRQKAAEDALVVRLRLARESWGLASKCTCNPCPYCGGPR